LIQGGYLCIPRKLFPEFVYFMGRNGGSDFDGMGESYLTLWWSNLTRVDKAWIRRSCFITQSVSLHFDEAQSGVVVNTEEDEVCLYETMFRTGFMLPFPSIV
jgi:hypothetical protein